MSAIAERSATTDRVSLRREIGLVGIMWASMGSIIGSGWLFGAQKGLLAAGPAAVISWVIGGVAILILALVHAELGAMYPVSGGSARFPHYAFGGAAGASFGWFSWLQAATVAPIEVSALIGYATHYSFAQGWQHENGTLSATGVVVAVVLMAIISSINFLGIRALAFTNSTATWWKIGVPLATILVVSIASGLHPSNFHAADGFAPAGAKGVLAAVSTSGIIFSYLGFEQADQLAGESTNPKRHIPIAVIGSILIGLVIYIALQIVSCWPCRPARSARPGRMSDPACTARSPDLGLNWLHWSRSVGWPRSCISTPSFPPVAPASSTQQHRAGSRTA